LGEGKFSVSGENKRGGLIMQRKTFSVLTAIMVAVVIFQLSGCSAIIDGISVAGDMASLKKDAAKKKYIIILPSAVHTIKPGTRIYVLLRSGAGVRGKYLEFVRVPAEEYATSYAKCREQIKEEIVLPELGETVTVITKTGKQHEREFLGFDYGTILTRVGRMGKTRTFKENIELIKNIVDSRGNIIGVEAVRKLISEGKIPLLSSGIIVKSKAGTTQIAWEDIYQIQVKKKGVPLAAKLGVVLIASALVIVLFAYYFSKEVIDEGF
jgi:hypothetical protein